MSRLRTTAFVLALGVSLAARAGTLAEGQPPLTDEVVSQYVTYYEWLFDTQLTNAQVNELKTFLVDTWKSKNESDIRSSLDVLKGRDDLAKMAPEERDMMRSQVQPQLLVELKRDKAPISKWALPVYASAHKALAAGKPPLTRQDTDSFAELMAFVVHEAMGTPAWEPDPAFREALAKAVTKGFSKVPAKKRDAVAKLTVTWAAVRATWPGVLEVDKAKDRKDWAGMIAFLKPKTAAAPAPVVAPASAKADAGAKADAPTENETARWLQGLLTAPLTSSLPLLERFSDEKVWRYDAKRAW